MRSFSRYFKIVRTSSVMFGLYWTFCIHLQQINRNMSIPFSFKITVDPIQDLTVGTLDSSLTYCPDCNDCHHQFQHSFIACQTKKSHDCPLKQHANYSTLGFEAGQLFQKERKEISGWCFVNGLLQCVCL